MAIQGLVDLVSTFRLELDVVTSGEFNAESLQFLTSGQVFGGTLALNTLAPASARTSSLLFWASWVRSSKRPPRT